MAPRLGTALACAAVLALAGCGGDDGDAGAGGTTGAGAPAARTDGGASTQADAGAGAPADVRTITEHAKVKLTGRDGATLTHAGPVTGTFDGTARMTTTIASSGVTVDFVVVDSAGEGSVSGTARVRARILGDDPLVRVAGTARITGGTGSWANARSYGLRLRGAVSIEPGVAGRVTLTGRVSR